MSAQRPLLLLHGALGAREQFDPLLPLLREEFEPYTLSFAGHGGQPMPHAFGIRHFALEVLEWLDRQSFGQIDIFGYSMGGYVGLYLARHHGAHVGRLFTLATKFRWNPETSAREVKMLDAEKIEAKVPQFAEELKRRHAPLDWKEVLARTAGMMTSLGETSEVTFDDLESIDHRVRVGVGDHDTMVSIDETVEMYRRLKNGELVILPGTQHPLERVAADRLLYELRDFFT